MSEPIDKYLRIVENLRKNALRPSRQCKTCWGAGFVWQNGLFPSCLTCKGHGKIYLD